MVKYFCNKYLINIVSQESLGEEMKYGANLLSSLNQSDVVSAERV
jgi:hypothetical protein